MRLIFMGTPRYAAVILRSLLDAGHAPHLVVTQPDRPAGRNQVLTPPPVKTVAEAAGLPTLQPEKITSDVRDQLIATRPDLILVAAFGKILRPALLAAPRFGCLNAHAGLLPAYRGAAPVNWTLIHGETETGVTVIKMDEGIDTGPILGVRKLAIAAEDNAGTLLDKLAEIAGPLLVETMTKFVAGEIIPQPQSPDGAGYAPQLKKTDGLLNWRDAANRIVNHVRGMTPWPGAWTCWRGKTIKVLAARVAAGAGEPGVVLRAKKELIVAAGEGALSLLQLQMEGKKSMDAASFLNGTGMAVGERLGPPNER
jgi:methionyl-tRNA formyltransferase